MRSSLLIALPLALASCGQPNPANNQAAEVAADVPGKGVDRSHKGAAAPDASFVNGDGEQTSVTEIADGKPLLVNLWASWCGPCIEEMPELDRYAAQQGDNGVQVIGIALDDAAAVEAFLQRIPVRYPILIDTPGPRDAGVQLGNPRGVLPYTALVSADGRLLKQRIGPFVHGELDDWARMDGIQTND